MPTQSDTPTAPSSRSQPRLSARATGSRRGSPPRPSRPSGRTRCPGRAGRHACPGQGRGFPWELPTLTDPQPADREVCSGSSRRLRREAKRSTRRASGQARLFTGASGGASGNDAPVDQEERAMDVAKLEDLLRETEEHHGAYEAVAPKHHWSSWYASYISSRLEGNTPERASTDAG